MATFTNSVSVRRPADEVFAYLARFENVPSWNYAIESTVKQTPGPVRVGTVFNQTRTVPRRGSETFEVTAFEPVSRLAIAGQIGPFQARLTYLLEPLGPATRLVNTVELEHPGPKGLLVPLALPGVKSAVAANLSALKELLES